MAMIKKLVMYRVDGCGCLPGYINTAECNDKNVYDLAGAVVAGAVVTPAGDCPKEVVVVCNSNTNNAPPQAPATSCGADVLVEVKDTLSQAVHTAPGTALKVKLCDPVANLKIEFSETLLYSASTEQKLYRIREYNEDSGVWAVRYEDEDGNPVGTLPPDLTSVTAQINVTRTNTLGCANGVPYVLRETARFDAETGALESETFDFVDSAGTVSVVAPAGFTLGACPAVCDVVAPIGVVFNWG